MTDPKLAPFSLPVWRALALYSAGRGGEAVALGSDPWPWPECLSWSDKQASTAELHLGSALPPDGGPTRG